jgi:cytochrome c
MTHLPTIRSSMIWPTFLVCAFLAGCVDESTSSGGGAPLTEAELVQIEDGRTMAAENCAACHAIGPHGSSPNVDAPPFRSLLSRYDAKVLTLELNEGMRVAHGSMPQFQFNPVATDSLIAYLRSVQTRDPGLALVEQRCARCHAIGATDTSPYPGAQAFRNLGRRWWRGQLRDALKTGIIVEHDKAEARVPPMKLTDPEIDAFLSYLDMIATDENPAPKKP